MSEGIEEERDEIRIFLNFSLRRKKVQITVDIIRTFCYTLLVG